MPTSPTDTLATVFLLIGLLTFIVNLIFAAGVLQDGDRLKKKGRETILAPFWVWALATAIAGVFGAAVYWLLHHSNLVDKGPDESVPVDVTSDSTQFE